MMEVDLNKMTISEIEEYLKEIKGKFVSLQEFRDLGDSDEKLKKINSILLASGVPERYLLSELIYGGQDFYDLELDNYQNCNRSRLFEKCIKRRYY